MHVIAHRGASRAERENTVAAFRRAAEMGADAVELDVRRTADGVLVVHHDAHLTAADGGAAIVARRAARPAGARADARCGARRLRRDVGQRRDQERRRRAGLRPDRLDRRRDDRSPARPRRPTTRWLISCFRIETIDRCRALAPQIRTAWLTGAVPADARGHCSSSAVTPRCTRGSDRLDRATDRRLPRRRHGGQHLDVRRPGAHGRADRRGASTGSAPTCPTWPSRCGAAGDAPG